MQLAQITSAPVRESIRENLSISFVIKANACQLSRHFVRDDAGAKNATMMIYHRVAEDIRNPLGDTAEI